MDRSERWATPTAQQLVDCLRLASRSRGDAYLAGVTAALRWVASDGPAPLTGTNVAAAAESAEAEFFAAGAVEMGESPLSAVVPPATAQGVGRTLSWLLGWERVPPVDLPRRPVPTAAQLYDEAVAAEPWRFDLPEEQALGRLAAQREAARLGRLAEQADAES